ncbi:hypothetical protein [Egbenema bharatensis]|uniref:hypothetical protein n=1 Tax=Egbenema bharatensis TaxID=3463334 RepID=UPI003A89F5D6
MTTSRALAFSVFLSGVVFSGATLFLVMTGSRPLTIQLEDRPVFSGRVQDLASPYLSVVAGLSVGIGLTSFTLLGWRNAVQELEQATEQVSILKQQLQQQEGMVESLRFSEAKLHASGLSFFVDSATPAGVTSAVPLNSASQPIFSVNPDPNTPEPVLSREAVPIQAQTPPLRSQPQPQHHPQHHPAQIEELTNSLRQIMNQIEQLKVAQASDRTDAVDASIHI